MLSTAVRRVRQLLQRKEDPEASQADAGSQPNLPWPVMQPAALILVPLMLGMHGKVSAGLPQAHTSVSLSHGHLPLSPQPKPGRSVVHAGMLAKELGGPEPMRHSPSRAYTPNPLTLATPQAC